MSILSSYLIDGVIAQRILCLESFSLFFCLQNFENIAPLFTCSQYDIIFLLHEANIDRRSIFLLSLSFKYFLMFLFSLIVLLFPDCFCIFLSCLVIYGVLLRGKGSEQRSKPLNNLGTVDIASDEDNVLANWLNQLLGNIQCQCLRDFLLGWSDS